ncbi:hypothetical protein HPG69_018793, partial [Diceros bicornis minor]
LLLCSVYFTLSLNEQNKMIKKEISMCQQTQALLYKNFKKWRMKKESLLVWFTIYVFPYLVNENPSCSLRKRWPPVFAIVFLKSSYWSQHQNAHHEIFENEINPEHSSDDSF